MLVSVGDMLFISTPESYLRSGCGSEAFRHAMVAGPGIPVRPVILALRGAALVGILLDGGDSILGESFSITGEGGFCLLFGGDLTTGSRDTVHMLFERGRSAF